MMFILTKLENRTLGVNLAMLLLAVLSIAVTLMWSNIYTGTFTVALVVIGLLHHLIYAAPIYKEIERRKVELSAALSDYEKGGE